MRTSIALTCALAGLTGCNQAADQPAANKATANAAAPANQPVFCFFKDEETRNWAASTDAKGNIVVKGKAHVKDARYKAQLGEPENDGTTARVWLSIGANSGYASPDDWWDVSATIPAGSGIQQVSVMCGEKSVADLPLKKG